MARPRVFMDFTVDYQPIGRCVASVAQLFLAHALQHHIRAVQRYSTEDSRKVRYVLALF